MKSKAKTRGGWFQRFVRTRVWKMDIHPSAHVAATAYVDRTWPKGIHIEAEVEIAEEAVVLTHDFSRGLLLDTRIGARTIVGPRAVVMPGMTIGADCLILPGALVTKDVPANSLVIGNPGKIMARVEGETWRETSARVSAGQTLRA